MSKKEIKLPEMGEGIIEATVSQYLVAVGDEVDTDTAILEVATDKIDSEVVSPFDGKIVELLFNEGDVVPVGAVVAIIEVEGEEEEVIATPHQTEVVAPQPQVAAQQVVQVGAAKKEVKLPEMGEGIIEATVSQYLIAVGDEVDTDTAILEVATDKVDSEVVSPFEGKIVELLFSEGDVVPIGAVVAIVEVEGAETEFQETVQVAQQTTPQAVQHTKYTQFISPTVRALLQTHNLPLSVLDEITPTGVDFRITKQDVEGYLAKKNLLKTESNELKQVAKSEPVAVKPAEKPKAAAPKITIGENDEVVEMDRMRKLIAHHMVASLETAPHVTSFIEADWTKMVNWRNKVKNEFVAKYGEKLTFTTLFVEAVVKAIQKYPMINISVDGDNIIKHGDINVGMATALPNGNLIVPVIHDARDLNLIGLAKRVNGLANKARNNKLAPTDIKGSTFTITNLGAFESLTGTPIINQPEVAILAVGAIQKKPVAVQATDGTYGVAVRDIMMLSMSYDHRVVDGGLGGNFLREVRDQIQNFDENRVI